MIRRFFIAFAVGFVCMFGATVSYACTSGEIDVSGSCEVVKFSVTTTSIAKNGTFKFYMAAKGTFYVDCGTGGKLSGTGVSGKTIDRASSVNNVLYTCTYSTAGVKTIRFGGVTTGYSTSYNNTSPIRFYGGTPTAVAKISGSLGGLFPSLGTANGEQPRFYRTFYGCTNLTGPLPANLFNGVTGAIDYMFYQTFYNCSKLTGYIPAGWFDGITTYSNQMMTDMFRGTGFGTACSGTTVQYTTGFEEYWNGKVSCTEPFVTPIVLDAQAATTTSAPTTVYLKYGIGWYSDLNATTSISALVTNPTKTDYIFNGYWTGVNGTETQVVGANGNFITNNVSTRMCKITDSDKTVYADWGNYVITYSCGDGTGTPPIDGGAVSSATFTPATNTCTREGYIFSGWAVSGTSDVQIGAFTWNYTENKTFTAQWTPVKFTITTINMPAFTSFNFDMSAKGRFYVDWGDGTPHQIINRTDTTMVSYRHKFANSGVYTITFGGEATGYNTQAVCGDSSCTAISFVANDNIATVSGAVGLVFPTLSGTSSNATNPRFVELFYRCDNLTDVPETLFNGVTRTWRDMFRDAFMSTPNLTSVPENLFGSVQGAPEVAMFYGTFSNAGLTSIPAGLFRTISGAPASNMFYQTFYGNTNVTGQIPAQLFSNIRGAPAPSMFSGTFEGCSGLTGSIPEGLFGNLSGAPAPSMFYDTFHGCSGLTGSIPAGLFGNLSGAPASNMFYKTFCGCTNLTGSIPSGLFGNLSGAPAPNMFYGTFYSCSRLTGSIPEGLFGNLSGAPAQGMFYGTFAGCPYLTGSIPEGLFGNLSGAPAPSMFYDTFHGCSGLTGSIPAGLFGNLSGAPAQEMFNSTFYGCSGLTGSIPEGLFGNLSGAGVRYMFISTFSGCSNLSGYVPSDIFENITSSNGILAAFSGTKMYTECPCGTKPAETGWGATVVEGRAVCEVGTKDNEHWNNGVCTTDCALGLTKLKSSTGLEYPILSATTTDHNINLSVGNGVCHIPLANGAANNAINASFGGATYHATVPDEIVPTGFTGQPAPVEPD